MSSKLSVLWAQLKYNHLFLFSWTDLIFKKYIKFQQ